MYQYIIVVLSCVPLIASLIPILSLRTQTGFTLDSLVLCALGLGITHSHINLSRLVPNSEFTAEIIRTYSFQVWVKESLILVMWVTVLLSFMIRFKFRPEEKFDANWVLGGVIGSIVLSNNFISNLPDSKKIDPAPAVYMLCAYLDVVAWIPQYKLTLKNERVDWREITYIVGMFTFDALTIAGLTFQYRLSQLYNPIGFNAIVLKFIFFCGFIFKYSIKHCRAAFSSQSKAGVIQTNNVIEVLYASSEPCVYCSDGKLLDNPICSIPEQVNISMDKSKLMIPA